MLYEVITTSEGSASTCPKSGLTVRSTVRLFVRPNFPSMPAFFSRITSYNVCYTKLLREADPSEVNLSSFETLYSEKRPFFVEGKDILSFRLLEGGGPLSFDNLFYTRRIGRAPGYAPTLSDNEYSKAPGTTSILGAAKLTGRTPKGWSLGFLESVTQSVITSYSIHYTKLYDENNPI